MGPIGCVTVNKLVTDLSVMVHIGVMIYRRSIRNKCKFTCEFIVYNKVFFVLMVHL